MDLISTIYNRLEHPLPGEEAQIQMAHSYRRKLWPPSENARNAGVLILLYPQKNDWHIVFIERESKNPNDVHRGQISFPGGRLENHDASLRDCALREAEEEIGISRNKVEVIGDLTPLFIPVSNFLVQPVIGYADYTPKFIPQPEEVKSIIDLPFNHFYGSQNRKHMDMLFGSDMEMKDVPYFDANGKVIWGATAMILSELLVILNKSHKALTENL